MGNEKQWQTDGNISTAADTAENCAREILWLLVALLTGKRGTAGRQGLWAPIGSSDGVTAGMDGIDRWGTAFDPAKLVWSLSDAAHSWIVLRSPANLGLYMTIDCCTPDSAAINKLQIRFSRDEPTGGTTTAAPTSTDGWAANDKMTMTPFTVSAWTELVATVHRCNLILATDGTWWFTVARGGAYRTVLALQRVDVGDGDRYPCVSFVCQDSTNGPLGASINSPVHATANAATNSLSTRGMRGRGSNAAQTECEFMALWTYNGTTSADVTFSISASEIDSTFAEFPVYLWGRMRTSYSTTYGVKGRIPDAYKVAASIAEGSVARDSSGKIYASVVSDWWLPWTADYEPLV